MTLRLVVALSAAMGAFSIGWSAWHLSEASWPVMVLLGAVHALFSLAFTFPISPGRHLNTGFVLALTGVFALPPSAAVLTALPGMALVLWQRGLGAHVWLTYIGSVSTGILLGGWVWQIWGAPAGGLSMVHVPAAIAVIAIYHTLNLCVVSARLAASSGQRFRPVLARYLGDIGTGGLALSLLALPLGLDLQAGIGLRELFYLAGLAGASDLTRVYVSRQELVRQARVDGLTGAFNRAAWEALAGKLASDGLPAGLLLVLDVDNMKSINDRHGHITGDEVLRDLVQTVQGTLRRADGLYRYGGDEFVTFLLDVKADSSVMERLQVTLKDYEDRWRGRGVGVGVSLGFGEAPGDGRVIADLFQLADQRMYEEKRRRASG